PFSHTPHILNVWFQYLSFVLSTTAKVQHNTPLSCTHVESLFSTVTNENRYVMSRQYANFQASKQYSVLVRVGSQSLFGWSSSRCQRANELVAMTPPRRSSWSNSTRVARLRAFRLW